MPPWRIRQEGFGGRRLSVSCATYARKGWSRHGKNYSRKNAQDFHDNFSGSDFVESLLDRAAYPVVNMPEAMPVTVSRKSRSMLDVQTGR